MQIFRNLKPYWKSVIIIALLLVLQAYCDLSLPDYTSKLIDTGIQNYGIENCSPQQIPEKAYKVIGGFMDDDEKAVWEKYYKDGSDGYYYLTEDGEEHIDEVDSACMKGLMMYYYPYQMVNSDEDNEIKTGLDKMGITLDEMPEEMWAQIGEQMKPTVDGMLDSMGEDYMESTAIACTRICYDSFGYDYKAGQMSYLKWAAVKMLGMSLLMAAAAVLIGLVASRVAASVACGLREKVFNKVIAFSDAEINKFSTASLITRSTNDVQQIQMVTVMMLRMVLYAPILSIGGIVKVVENGAGMGWVIFIGIAAVVILMGTLMVIAMPKFKVMQTLVDRVNLVSREILTGIPVIRAFGREEREEERFDEANKDLTKNTLFVNRVMTFAMPILMFIMYAISILIEWVAAHKIDAGVLQVGSMTAFITYTMLIIMSFLMLSMMSVMLPRASVAADRIQEIIDTDVTVQDAAGANKLEAPRGVVKYDNVAFAYPGADENVLENISFEAKPGQTTAIIGSTGCGKSTLVQLLPRFYDVTEGSITIDGQDIRDLTMESVRQNIGFVPQKGILFSGTIASNIRFGAPDASDEDVKLAAEIAQASDFIEEKEHGYDSAVAQGGGNVSGGQKQRLAIARAIARKPKILIFDDSFSALDFKTDVAVRKALGEHVNDSTVFIVAQRVSTILSADQILVLDEGTIVGKGTHKELMQTCEEYRQIAESQLSPSEIAASLGTDSERQV
ncbi:MULTISPECIES: ABC transporter ATP-binding protein [Coprococcus]|jgi:ATP-binding cassette subfamily B multidrug efflux pump|uniref:ABC transporter ATP-binding protein n=1 Tax=Coprococcus TaxID=33042 RepID=UPI000E736424|nr:MULTISPECIES: ABC transporter ATP-binding protein [Coprococcus]RJW76456.1 ABC transporter ATP-binding protein [Coprococcus sp. AF38-1]